MISCKVSWGNRRVKGAWTWTFDTSEFPSPGVFFVPFLLSSSYPTPLCAAATPPHPAHSPPSSESQPQTLSFCMKGFNPMNNPVCLSQNKPVGEESWSESGRLEQRGAQPLVISPWSGSSACLDPQLFSSIYTALLPAWLPDWLDWLAESPSTVAHSLSLSVLLPRSFPPTLESESAQIGKVLLRPACGQLEDST